MPELLSQMVEEVYKQILIPEQVFWPGTHKFKGGWVLRSLCGKWI